MLRLRLAAVPLAALLLSLAPLTFLPATAGAASPAAEPVQGQPASAATPPAVGPITAAGGSGSWTEYHHDDAHTGYDSAAPAASGATAGWTSPTLNGQIYGEPLVYNGLVYVATLQNVVYALHQLDGTVAWSKTLPAPQTTGWQCGNINPTGILGTGIIDPTANRIYYVPFLKDFGTAYYLYALDLTTGNILMTTEIAPTGFDWTIQQQRGALALSTDRTHVYVPFGGRAGDCGPYHGWVVGVPTNGTAPDESYETVSTGEGIWAGGGVVVDDSTNNVLFATGNAIPCGGSLESDSVIRTNSTLQSPAQFQPPDWDSHWCSTDTDLGSVTPVLISPSLMFTTGKYGQGFLISPSSMAQLYPSPSPYNGVDVCLGTNSNASFGSVSYANGRVYLTCQGHGVVSLTINSGAPSFSSCDSTCSAAGTWHANVGTVGPPIIAGGVVWALGIGTPGSGLWGFNATTGAQVYHSAGFTVNHFATPSEAGGQIFAPAGNTVKSFNFITGACTSVTDTPAPASPQVSGTSITYTATSTNCPNPLYQFWIRPPGGSWQIAKAYSSANTFTWNTVGLAPGDYLYTAWARDASSAGTQCSSLGCNDAFFVAQTLTLTLQPCTSVNDSPAPGPPQLSGTSVIFTATSTGCPNPRYQFWILPPGGSWQIVRAYSATSTFTWNTTGLAPGNYMYTAWARDAASTGTQCSFLGCNDAFFVAQTYTLNRQPCASVNDSPAPGSPQLSATSITFSATSTGCPNPLYQFWIRPPGGSWQVARAYSSSTTFTWDTTGLAPGDYLYTAWVRDASSSGTQCSSLGCNDAFFVAQTFTLTSQPCTSVNDSPTPGSPQPSGTGVTFTATSTGCPHPLYQFWIRPPGGSWQIAKAYSSSTSFTWDTTGLAPGSYLYTAWVRDASSSGTQCSSLGCNDAFFVAQSYGLT